MSILDFDFSKITADFKEDSVRELIIHPLLVALSFEGENAKKELGVRRSVAVKSDTIIGANKHIAAEHIIIPDYLLIKNNKTFCVLDAKAPSVPIDLESKAERQAFFYAINKNIGAPFYALCNGVKLIIFETAKQNVLLEIIFKHELHMKFGKLRQFVVDERVLQAQKAKGIYDEYPAEWYLNRPVPTKIEKPKKQAANRYFGCNAYFTRQSWDVLQENINTFTAPGDVVLDPFGGSGITAIEAMMRDRIGVHTDLNPLSIFMTKAITAPVDTYKLQDVMADVLDDFQKQRSNNDKEARTMLKSARYYPNAISKEFGETATQKTQNDVLWIPKDEVLPKGADVETLHAIFTPTQFADLALLRHLILKHTTPSGDQYNRDEKRHLRYALLLAFYNTITMCNKTFHDTPRGGGVCGVFNYFRYRVAPKPANHDVADTFKRKVDRVIRGKRELRGSPYFYDLYWKPVRHVIKKFKGAMLYQRKDYPLQKNAFAGDNVWITEDKTNGEKFFQADACNLREIENKSVDFIYTDPPYGAKIPYLDLSTLWNAWLDFPVDLETRQKECIEKGSLEKNRADYVDLMKESLKEMYRVLKFNRWLAFVFQHQDPQLWQILVETAESIGFEYVASVRQNNGQASFRKEQNPFRVLKGQLILYFKKVSTPQTRIQENVGDVMDFIFNDIEATIAKNNGATLEEIFGDLQIRGIEMGFLHELAKIDDDIIDIINTRYALDRETEKYHLKKGERFRFGHKIDVRLRARYFILSFLHSKQRQKQAASFDDICLEVIPLLKNGITPDKSLIRDILEEVALPIKQGGEVMDQWVLKPDNPSLFDQQIIED